MCHGDVLGALNDKFDWVANALGLTFVDPNSWIEDGDFARDLLHLNGRGKRRLGQLYARVSGLDNSGLDNGGSAGVGYDKFWRMKITERGIQGQSDHQGSENRRLYMKKVDHCLVS